MHGVRRRWPAVWRHAHGFSLVEVLISSVVLAAAVVSLVHVFVTAARANVEARDSVYAVVLASAGIEELRAVPFPQYAPPEAVAAFDVRGAPLDSADSPDAAYLRRLTVEPLAADPTRAVVITSTAWGRGSSESRAVRLVTIRTRLGPP